jgi:hypothetical protein
MKKLKKGTISLCLGTISLGIFLNSCQPFSCKEYVKANILNENVSGIIKEKKETSPCFGNVYFNSDSLELCICSNKKIWEAITVGDSLHKNKNTDTFMLFRNNTLKETFKYSCCDQ